MDSVNRVQNLDKAVYVTLCTHALGKDMNPSPLPPAMSK